MSESSMRGRIIRHLRSLDAVAIENRVGIGTPDVECMAGWLELKWLRRWPKTSFERPVLLPHYTQQQRLWLMRRWRRGGGAWLLLQVGQEYMLFTAPEAQKVGKLTRDELYQAAAYMCPSGLNERGLIDALKRAGEIDER